jgi:hypothetical protein
MDNSIAEWIHKEIEALTQENAAVLEWQPGMHPNPAAMSNMCRLHKSNGCRAKIEAYLKLLDYMEGKKDA